MPPSGKLKQTTRRLGWRACYFELNKGVVRAGAHELFCPVPPQTPAQLLPRMTREEFETWAKR